MILFFYSLFLYQPVTAGNLVEVEEICDLARPFVLRPSLTDSHALTTSKSPPLLAKLLGG